MPTIAIGSSLAWARTATAAWRRRRRSPRPAGAWRGRRRWGSRRRAVAGRRRPVSAPEPVAQLDRGERVEAELLEGPAGVDRLGAEPWPRTAATSPRTSSRTWPPRAPPRAGRRAWPPARSRRRRGAARGSATRPPRIGGRVPADARARRLAAPQAERQRLGAAGAQRCVEERQALLVGERRRSPSARIRARSASPSCEVMPLSACQRPQAIEVAGRPSAWRFRARASRKTLAAA